jgi:hypothetical protein
MDHRQREQILSVSNELKAPQTPMGHGDAFFSIALALQAAYETGIYNIETVANLQDFAENVDPSLKNVANLDKNKPDTLLDFDQNKYNDNMESPNPSCTLEACNPTFWVPKRKLCLYCNYRGN